MPLFAAEPPPAHEVAASFAFDSTFVGRARYGHGFAGALGSSDLLLGATWTVPLFATRGLSDWGLAVDGATGWTGGDGPLGIELGLGTGVARALDERGRMLAWSMDARIRPGAFWTRFRLTGDLAWRPTFATHVRPSALVRRTFEDRYPGAERPTAGWVRTPSGRLVLGASAAWLAPVGLTLSGGGGWSRVLGPLPAFPDIGVLPFEIHLAIGWQR